MTRDLSWAGCLNVRDLGGLTAAHGRRTNWGAIVRSDNPAYLTDRGWAALRAHGIRTIVALRTEGVTDDEVDVDAVPPDITIRRVFVEDGTDRTFVERCVVTGRFGSPLYFPDMLAGWPERCAAAVAAVADADPGGIVIACGRGCDRTGLVTFLLLGLVGVPAPVIAADWSSSIERLRPREPDFESALMELLKRERTTVGASVESTLSRFDITKELVSGGLTPHQLEAVQLRLVGPPNVTG